MKVVLFDYALIFLLLFFLITFIIFTTRVINLVISLMFFSFLMSYLFLRLSFEYLAFIYLIIYFGAVIMLFLFVVMLLDINNVFDPVVYYVNLNFLFFCFVCIKLFFIMYSFLKVKKISNYINTDFNLYTDVGMAYSTINAVISFFNYYWVWLILIGGLLLVLVVGLINALTDTHRSILELYEDKKKNSYV